MRHASLEDGSAMLLLKMLQPDEGIMALGRILWGLAKASGVNRLECYVWSSMGDILLNANGLSPQRWQKSSLIHREFSVRYPGLRLCYWHVNKTILNCVCIDRTNVLRKKYQIKNLKNFDKKKKTILPNRYYLKGCNSMS